MINCLCIFAASLLMLPCCHQSATGPGSAESTQKSDSASFGTLGYKYLDVEAKNVLVEDNYTTTDPSKQSYDITTITGIGFNEQVLDTTIVIDTVNKYISHIRSVDGGYDAGLRTCLGNKLTYQLSSDRKRLTIELFGKAGADHKCDVQLQMRKSYVYLGSGGPGNHYLVQEEELENIKSFTDSSYLKITIY